MVGIDMLHRTAAAVAKMRTTRVDPVSGALEQFNQFRLVITATTTAAPENNLLAFEDVMNPGLAAGNIHLAKAFIIQSRNDGGLRWT
jgi:hypothetical protein